MTAPAAPTRATIRFRAVPSATSWRLGKPKATKVGVLLALDDALPTERLADDGQADQCGQDSEHPPAHGLGMDRCRHRRGRMWPDLRHRRDEVSLRGRSEPGEVWTSRDEVERGRRKRARFACSRRVQMPGL